LLICSSLISALFKRAIVRSLAQSLFKKEQMSNCSFVTLLKIANEQSLFLSLFSKERRKERWLFCSFKKSERAKMSKK